MADCAFSCDAILVQTTLPTFVSLSNESVQRCVQLEKFSLSCRESCEKGDFMVNVLDCYKTDITTWIKG